MILISKLNHCTEIILKLFIDTFDEVEVNVSKIQKYVIHNYFKCIYYILKRKNKNLMSFNCISFSLPIFGEFILRVKIKLTLGQNLMQWIEISL